MLQRNTSVAIRLPGQDGQKVYVFISVYTMQISNGFRLFRTIVIDVGKSFQTAAVEWFPKYGLRRIDAVLITHAHADGMSALSFALTSRPNANTR